jgi:hypothetical protein
VNLIDHRSIGVPVIRFKNYRAFQAYTMNGCIYPREMAKKEGFIKALLRKLSIALLPANLHFNHAHCAKKHPIE